MDHDRGGISEGIFRDKIKEKAVSEFKKIFKKVGGKEVLKQYAQSHVLLFAFLCTIVMGFSRKSLELVRLAVENKLLCKFRKKYKTFICNYLQNAQDMQTKLKRERSNKVWVCWMQGMEHAPELVKVCFESLRKHLGDREIIVITAENLEQYVTFPDYIKEKYASGIITQTHFSDLLRVELLAKYGGTWIDATVLCTDSRIPGYMLDSDLFLYQCLKPGRDGHACVASSWFITACTNHPMILLVRELFHEYWKKNNVLKDYFLVHYFFQLAIETYPGEWSRVVPVCNSTPHILLLNIFERFDADWLNSVEDMTCFHKLSYKFSEEQTSQTGTCYEYLLKTGKQE